MAVVRDFIDRHGVGRWFVNFTLIVLMALSVYWINARTAKAEDALCILRAEQIDAQKSAQKYLDDVAKGLRQPVAGITEADITNAMRNRQRSIDALSILNCG